MLQAGAIVTGTAIAGCIGRGGGVDTISYIGRGGVTQDAMREVSGRWEEETGVTIEHSSVANDTEMMNVIEANPGDIDLCNPSPSGFALARADDLLADLEYDELPNYFENIAEPWHSPPFLEGHDDGVYRYISSQGLAYNTEEVDPFTSWDEILKDDYEDAVSLHASPHGRFANAAAAAGEDLNLAPEDDDVWEAIQEKARQQHENIFTYWASGDEHMRLLREERAMISSAWGGRIRNLQQDGVPVEYFIPDEGAVTWSEGYAIPRNSEKQETAHDLLNWLYERENLVELSDLIGYPAPMDDPPEVVRELPDYTEHPDDLTWLDWDLMVPFTGELTEALAEIRGS